MHASLKVGLGIASLAITLLACKKSAPRYVLFGVAPGLDLDPVTAVVNGTEYKARDGSYLMPSTITPASINTLAFRYQTVCGAFDVPYELRHKTGALRVAGEVVKRAGAPHLAKHVVLVDSRGEASHDVVIGKMAVRAAPPPYSGVTDSGWDDAWTGAIFGPECGADHPVTFNGKTVGTISGTAPAGLALDSLKQDELPIFVTPKTACYHVRQLALETVDNRSGVVVGSTKAIDLTLRGPGAFYLPVTPELFMKEPTKAYASSGIYEVPCDAP